MAHQINYNEQKSTHSFASHSEKAWHGLGQIVDKAMTASEAIELANLDYKVYKTSIHPMILDANGNEIYSSAIPERFATLREDNNAYLGQVSSRYEIIQNKDAFSFFDSIIDDCEAIFETAGALGNGERIFVTVKLPNDFLVKGEPCTKYLILTNSHDGTSAVIVGFTSVRIVCANTLQAALQGLSNKVSIQHKLGAKDRIAEAYKVMGIASQYMKEVETIFNVMANTPIKDVQLKSYITDVMKPEYKGVTESEKEEISTRLKNQVDAIYNFALSHPTQISADTEGTVWGAYNSISGYYNYIAKFRSQEDKFKSVMFGNANNRINKGFTKALELVQ